MADIAVGANIVEAVTEFRYLGSIQSSSSAYYPDLHRRIGVASSVAFDAALLVTTETESGHQAATLSDLHSSDAAVRC